MPPRFLTNASVGANFLSVVFCVFVCLFVYQGGILWIKANMKRLLGVGPLKTGYELIGLGVCDVCVYVCECVWCMCVSKKGCVQSKLFSKRKS